MSKKYYFQDLHLSNFRLFRKLDVEGFKRINIIGGFNGAGKSALLETLFCLLDIHHPLSLVKPYNFRGTAVAGEEGVNLIFADQSLPATISYKSGDKSHTVTIQKSKLPNSAISALSANTVGGSVLNGSNLLVEKAVKVTSGSGSSSFESFLVPQVDGYAGTITKLGDTVLPPGQFLSQNTRVSPVDLSGWVSDCIKSSKIDLVLEHLRLLGSTISELVILYNGPNPTIYARRNKTLLPIDLLGDGFRNLLTTILAIFRMNNGVVFLDEIDTALHYSVTSDFWGIIAKAANEANCQIFATSHSREAILSAAKGVTQAGARKDFCYMRIEMVDDEHRILKYTMDEIEVASEYGFEFR